MSPKFIPSFSPVRMSGICIRQPAFPTSQGASRQELGLEVEEPQFTAGTLTGDAGVSILTTVPNAPLFHCVETHDSPENKTERMFFSHIANPMHFSESEPLPYFGK